MKKSKSQKFIKIPFIIAVIIIFLVAIFVFTFQYSRSWENGLFQSPLYRLNTSEKFVALTFDDGPSDTRTPALLELLQEQDVTATFFMLGENIDKHPDIARQVFLDGHLIGNHSYNHPRLIFKSPAFVTNQITRTDELIKSTGQSNVSYFRPPYSSKYIILPLVLNSMGKTLVTGTFDPPGEYLSPYNAQTVSDEVVSHIQPGSIIYMHDGKTGDVEEFIQSVELIITELHKKGYQFVRLDEIV